MVREFRLVGVFHLSFPTSNLQSTFRSNRGRAGIVFARYAIVSDLLVVDDDNDVALPLITYLEIQGHEVRYAEDGQAALHAISEKFPDLILLDIEMPRLTGP